jgi:hypothetical protein
MLTRYPAALALVLALAATAPAAPVDPLLPDDTDFVMSIQVKQMIGSALFQKHAAGELKKALDRNGEALKVLGAMGIDPLTSFDRLILAGTTSQPDKLFGIVRGSFDGAKVMAQAGELAKNPEYKVEVVKDGGPAILKIGEGKWTMYAAPVGSGAMVLAATPEQVRASLARSADTKPQLKPAMAALIGQFDEKQSLSMAGLTAGALGKVPVPIDDAALKDTLEKIQSISGSVNVTADAKLSLTFGLKDAAAAGEFGKLLEDALVFAKGLVPQLAAQNPRMGLAVELVQSLRPETKGAGVNLTGEISGPAFEKALK